MEKKEYPKEYAIWEKTGKNGKIYLSMKTPDGKWVTLFKNGLTKGNQPTWKEAPPLPDKQDIANSNHNFGNPPNADQFEDIPF